MPSERRRRGMKVLPLFCIDSGEEKGICLPPADSGTLMVSDLLLLVFGFSQIQELYYSISQFTKRTRAWVISSIRVLDTA
ncbi:hypothetical protein [Neisseria lactamica]|uniref:hypothetical protein n=1 Tax=Neisseria lactamica TaxID=486 RepID=UPI00159E5023|nr:hypothetical protein [Neisseria lactamica]